MNKKLLAGRVFQRIVHIQIVTRASIALLLHLALHIILLDQFHVTLKDHSKLHLVLIYHT